MISLDSVLKTKVILIFSPLSYLQLLVLNSALRTAALLIPESWSCVFVSFGNKWSVTETDECCRELLCYTCANTALVSRLHS